MFIHIIIVKHKKEISAILQPYIYTSLISEQHYYITLRG